MPSQDLDGAYRSISERVNALIGEAAAHTEQHCALRAVVGAPVRAGDRNIAVGIRCSNLSARLVAVGAQVALAAIIGLVFESVERHWGGGLQSPVRFGVAGVNLVTGPAVLAGRIGISNLE